MERDGSDQDGNLTVVALSLMLTAVVAAPALTAALRNNLSEGAVLSAQPSCRSTTPLT